MVTFSHGAEGERNTTDWFVSRLRGTVTAPVSGKYRFWISGDDHCELWLSSNDRKFYKKLIAKVAPAAWEQLGTPTWTEPLDWDKYSTQASDQMVLQKGRSYFIEILHKDGNGNDHVSVAWQFLPEGETKWSDRRLIDASALQSHVGDTDDGDDDYLPDTWEEQYGLNPKDNGLVGKGKEGEAGDYDGDLLTNREEFLLGTNPCSPDTDGDGVGDYDEVKTYGSDPKAKDAVPPVLHADVPLDGFIAPAGAWQFGSDGLLTSIARRGQLAFTFETDTPGIYVLELGARAISANPYVPPVPLIASVDGVEVGRGEAGPANSTFSWMTRWLEPGKHRVVIDNRNVRREVQLAISSVKLLKIAGDDLDGNQLPDWMEKLFRDRNGVDGIPQGEVIASSVSPMFLEGYARTAESTGLTTDGLVTLVKPGVGNKWFADVPLKQDGETGVSVSFEGSSIRKDLRLRWDALDPFVAPERFDLRVGDTLKLSVPKSGALGENATCQFTVGGKEIYSGPVGGVAFMTAQEPGEHLVTARVAGAAGESTHEFTVVAHAADFGATYHLAAREPRIWNLPGIAPSLSLDHESQLSLVDTGEPKEGRCVRANWDSTRTGPTRVLARLWPQGPVASATSVNVFRLVDATESGDANVVAVLPDGTRVVELAYLIEGEIPKDFSLWIDFYVTDAVFEDGSTRYHLTAADFDEQGMARLKIFKAPGEGMAYVCHWNHLNQDEEESAGTTEAGQ
jgi:hypothetical protein